ncbi:MAG TPA: cupredoxin domain-containing protein [Solirubrobacterales bacterium]|nr:cupredoxin domain-containing protein [Solirubrobacterales bacterium]
MIRLLGTLGLLLMLAASGCGGEEDGGSTAKKGSVAPKPGSNVPEGGKTVVATVFEGGQKGIPADVGQWMVDIGVPRGDDLAFTVGKAITPSGNANFRLRNPQAVGHNLTIEEVDAVPVKEPFERVVRTPVVRKGSGWVRVPFWEGQHYVFYCSIPGHREAGMEGVIEVDSQLEAEDLKPF